eukprot:1741948-Rhodomonas_salina.1
MISRGPGALRFVLLTYCGQQLGLPGYAVIQEFLTHPVTVNGVRLRTRVPGYEYPGPANRRGGGQILSPHRDRSGPKNFLVFTSNLKGTVNFLFSTLGTFAREEPKCTLCFHS